MRRWVIALGVISALYLAVLFRSAPVDSRARISTLTPTPSNHVVLSTPTTLPVSAPTPALSVVWARPGLAHASWAGFACLHRYSISGVHLFVGCAPDAIETPAAVGDTFRITVAVGGAVAVSERISIRGAALMPIVKAP